MIIETNTQSQDDLHYTQKIKKNKYTKWLDTKEHFRCDIIK